jgi:hypothetical protein
MNELRKRTFTFIGLSALGITCGIAVLVTDLLALRSLAQVASTTHGAALRESAALAQRQSADEIFSIAFLAIVVVFLFWVFGNYRNFVRAGVPDLQRSPWWAVIDFLVPLVNLVLPYLVATEIWSKSARLAGRPAEEINRRRYTLSWWLACLAAVFFTRIGERWMDSAFDAADLGNAMKLLVFGDLSRVAALILGGLLVVKVSRFRRHAAPAFPGPAPALS